MNKTLPLLLASALVCAPVVGASTDALLSPEAKAMCDAEGGCHFVTQGWIENKIQKAWDSGAMHGYALGFAEGTEACATPAPRVQSRLVL